MFFLHNRADTIRAGSLALAILAMGGSFPASALDPSPEQATPFMLQTAQDRKRLIADNLPLTVSEARQFWPIYDRYQAELQQLVENRRALLSELGENYENMTDAVARHIVKGYLDLQEARLRLLKSYIPKFDNALPANKLARYFQIEAKIRAAVDSGIAEQIPLVQ